MESSSSLTTLRHDDNHQLWTLPNNMTNAQLLHMQRETNSPAEAPVELLLYAP